MGYNAFVVLIFLWVILSIWSLVEKVQKFRVSDNSLDKISLKKDIIKLVIALLTLLVTIIQKVI